MNNVKLHATYIGIAIGLFSFSFLASGWNKASLLTLAIAFALTATLFAVSQKFKPRWLVRITGRIGKIRVGHLATFLMLYALAITLLNNNLVLVGQILALAAYVAFGLRIGSDFGSKVLRPILTKLNS